LEMLFDSYFPFTALLPQSQWPQLIFFSLGLKQRAHMKRTVNVVHVRLPQSGRHIGEGHHDYFLTPDGAPAMHFRWRGLVFNGPKMEFVFPRDVVRIGRVEDDAAKSAARWSSAYGASLKGGAAGVVGSLVSAAIGAAATRTSGIKGFGVFYKNDQGHLATFTAVASPEIVDEILRAVPQEKHDKSAETAPLQQPTKPDDT
jgi:hypothetical protein